MARAGARGETATEMDAVLRYLGTDEHAAWLNALDAALATRTGTFEDASGEPQPVTLRIANAPFAQRDMTLETAYLEALASRFGAGLRLVDYRTRPEAAAPADQRLGGRADRAADPRAPRPGRHHARRRLTLVNAIYLKARLADAVHRGAPRSRRRSPASTARPSTCR